LVIPHRGQVSVCSIEQARAPERINSSGNRKGAMRIKKTTVELKRKYEKLDEKKEKLEELLSN